MLSGTTSGTGMKTCIYFTIFCLTFCDLWATAVVVTAWEGQVTFTAPNASSPESITHTTPLIRTPVTTAWGQNPPPPTSAPCSQVHVGSLLAGMILGFSITLFVRLGYKLISSRQQGRYRALEQHDVII